ncbi:hypothetical protein BDR04DRAFT_1120019 [Suillus decipiens]|nr:hypothetical protein BDR04DRAFT_1120019 [Suillus decipiens]
MKECRAPSFKVWLRELLQMLHRMLAATDQAVATVTNILGSAKGHLATTSIQRDRLKTRKYQMRRMIAARRHHIHMMDWRIYDEAPGDVCLTFAIEGIKSVEHAQRLKNSCGNYRFVNANDPHSYFIGKRTTYDLLRIMNALWYTEFPNGQMSQFFPDSVSNHWLRGAT